MKKLEAATEGSRELDALVWCAVNGVEFLYGDGMSYTRCNVFNFRNSDGHARGFSGHPAYTTSLDAARTLVPEGMKWGVGSM